MKEVLLWSLVTIVARISVSELDKWAEAVRAEHATAIELRERWKPQERSWGAGKFQASKIFEPLARRVAVQSYVD